MADKYYTSNFDIQKQETYSETVEEGVVISQNVAPGSQIGKKSKIILTVSKGLEYVSFPTNGVVGVDYNNAKALLEKMSYKVTKVEKNNPGGYIEGTVYQSSLDSGELYPKGSQVILTVWGAEPTTTTEPPTDTPTDGGTIDDQGGFLQQILG